MTTLVPIVGGVFLIAGSWLLLATVLAGVGLLVRRPWQPSEQVDLDEAFTLIWSGYAAALLVLQIMHFFRPIDAWPLVILGTAGATGLAMERRSVRLAVSGVFGTENRVPMLAFALFVVWAANRCAGPLTLYDSGMYHVPAVEWFKAHPIVPGLGNLHGRLAFNPASLLFAAMLDRGPFASGANHLANGFVLVLLAAEVLRRATRLVRGDRLRTRSDVMAIVLLPAIVMMFVRQDARSLSTDVVVTGLLMAIGLRLFDAMQYPPLVRPRRAYDLAALALMASAAVCVKLSAAPFAALAVALAMYAAVRVPRTAAVPGRQLLAAGVLPALLVGTWLVRGVILSGYPLYPVRLFAAPVEWRVPAEQAAAEAAWVQMSARYLNTNNIGVGFDWMSLWLGDILTRGDLVVHITVPLLILAGIAAHVLVRRRPESTLDGHRSMPDEPNSRTVALLFGALLCTNAAIWFLSAPHTRFGQSTFWLAAGLALSVRIAPALDLGDAKSRDRRRVLGAVVGLTALLWTGHVAGTNRRSAEGFSWRALAREFVTMPGSRAWLDPMPEPRLVEYVTESGLTLRVPVNDNACWNGPLLCTPHPAPNLSLRRDSEIASGFMVQGTWSATRFPNPWTPFLLLWRCQQERGSVPKREHDRACLARARGEDTRGGPGS